MLLFNFFVRIRNTIFIGICKNINSIETTRPHHPEGNEPRNFMDLWLRVIVIAIIILWECCKFADFFTFLHLLWDISCIGEAIIVKLLSNRFSKNPFLIFCLRLPLCIEILKNISRIMQFEMYECI